jgi:hypothetical protein
VGSDYGEIQVAPAETIVEEHVRVCVPESVCRGCLRPWPCHDLERARAVLTREGRADV